MEKWMVVKSDTGYVFGRCNSQEEAAQIAHSAACQRWAADVEIYKLEKVVKAVKPPNPLL